jgi:hypothetical protein
MSSDDELLGEYDFSKGVRGKYANRARNPSRSVLIERDLFEQFPSDQAVNDALRELLRRRSRDPAHQ